MTGTGTPTGAPAPTRSPGLALRITPLAFLGGRYASSTCSPSAWA